MEVPTCCTRVYFDDVAPQPRFTDGEGLPICQMCAQTCLLGKCKPTVSEEDFMCCCTNCLYEQRHFSECHEYIQDALRVTLTQMRAKMNQQIGSKEKQQMMGRLSNYLNQVRQYEDPNLQTKIKSLVPEAELRKFAEAVVANGGALSLRDQFCRELLRWFKGWFTWVNTVPCERCGKGTKHAGMGQPNQDDLKYGAGRVELHCCNSCGHMNRYPRYNAPTKLLDTRRGRCGEWANCFSAILRAFEFDSRFVVDFTDHVWSEVWSEDLRRWVHMDCCENAWDSPRMYEQGWNKKLNYVFGVSLDEVVDVTKRYTVKLNEVNARRTMLPESQLAEIVKNLRSNLLSKVSAERRKFVEDRWKFEQMELIQLSSGSQKELKQSEKIGRQTGSLEWRLSRGEAGDLKQNMEVEGDEEEVQKSKLYKDQLTFMIEYPEVGLHDHLGEFDDLDDYLAFGGFHIDHPGCQSQLTTVRYQMTDDKLTALQAIYTTLTQKCFGKVHGREKKDDEFKVADFKDPVVEVIIRHDVNSILSLVLITTKGDRVNLGSKTGKYERKFKFTPGYALCALHGSNNDEQVSSLGLYAAPMVDLWCDSVNKAFAGGINILYDILQIIQLAPGNSPGRGAVSSEQIEMLHDLGLLKAGKFGLTMSQSGLIFLEMLGIDYEPSNDFSKGGFLCRVGKNQNKLLGPNLIWNKIHQVEGPATHLHLKLKAFGKGDDNPFKLRGAIYKNGVNMRANHPGFGMMAFDCNTGELTYHNYLHPDTLEEAVMQVNDSDIVVICTHGELQKDAELASNAIALLGGKLTVFEKGFSFVLVGSKQQPDWCSCSSAKPGEGPVELELSIPLSPIDPKLKIDFVSDFELIFDRKAPLQSFNYKCWAPIVPEGHFYGGSILRLDERIPAFAVSFSPENDELLAPPVTFERVWSHRQGDSMVAAFQALAPEGFVALGDIIMVGPLAEEESLQPEVVEEFRCVSESCVLSEKPFCPLPITLSREDPEKQLLWLQYDQTFNFGTVSSPVMCNAVERACFRLNPRLLEYEKRESQSVPDQKMDVEEEVQAEKMEEVAPPPSPPKELTFKQIKSALFKQLTKGCGKSCSTANCAGNPEVKGMKVIDAAKKSVILAKEQGQACVCPNLI